MYFKKFMPVLDTDRTRIVMKTIYKILLKCSVADV